MVLNGHDHTYSRGHVPLRTSNKYKKNNLGTVYVTSVSGPKQYELDTEQIKAYTAQGYQLDKSYEQTQFYQVISIHDNNLIYEAYTTLGELYDKATIIKNFKTGEKKLLQHHK